jgi:uncharacterized protein YecE (DUF72 family)
VTVPTGLETALEIRNPKWLNDAHFEFITGRSLVPVLLQGYWMPSVTDVYREWRHLIDRCGTVVIRLHGPDREGMDERTGKRWDTLVVRRDDELREIVGTVQELLGAGVDVYLAVNNHFEGCAPLTIERIQSVLGGPRAGI